LKVNVKSPYWRSCRSNQHAINRQSACNRHLEGQREVAVLALLPLKSACHQQAISMQSAP
jgi:hypothetical protein